MYSFILVNKVTQIFQTITLEGWTEIMIFEQLTTSNYCWIYNVFIAFFGNFVIINLLLAIVAIKFLQSQVEVRGLS